MRFVVRPPFVLLAFLLIAGNLFSAEVIPPKPPRHFNDFAGATSVPVQQQLDRTLDELEKTDSTQIVVAIYRKMQSDADIAEYTVRVAETWKAGTAKKDNGAVLFVFVEDRKMYLQVGYGLEAVIPDITAKDITENRIKPHFRNNDYNAGMTAGVDAIIKAVRGEYQGAGRTAVNRKKTNWAPLVILGLFLLMTIASTRRKRGHVYGKRGHQGWGGPVIWPGMGGGGGWSGGSRGGGGGGGGGWGGGFSGGGGSFGGGGAGSSW